MARYDKNYRKILGVKFFIGEAREAVQRGMSGGLVVVPSAPVLVNAETDSDTRQAVSLADLAITDSSLMVMTWNLTRRDNISRVSGLEYLTLLLRSVRNNPGEQRLFLVLPSEKSAVRTHKWLNEQKIPCGPRQIYVAPIYGPGVILDDDLLRRIEEVRPTQILIGLGGGTQERLGFFLRIHLPYNPGIHCIGAAIAFLTGEQVKIPLWVDHLYLGWLLRCFSKPKAYIPRYWKARKLVWRLLSDEESGSRGDSQIPMTGHE